MRERARLALCRNTSGEPNDAMVSETLFDIEWIE